MTVLFWGLILGTAGMFLFATKRGHKLKQFLSEHGRSFLDELEEFYNEFESQSIPEKKLESLKVEKQPAKKKKQSRVKKIVDESAMDISHIAKLQERGRKATRRFFSRKGKKLR